MRSAHSFPLRLHYGLHLTILALNFTVLVSMAWEYGRILRPDFEGGFADLLDAVWPMAAIIITSIALIYTITVVILSLFRVEIPHLARILVDSLALAPAYAISILVLAIGTKWSYIGNAQDLEDECSDPFTAFLGCNSDVQLLETMARLQLVAMIFGFTALVLTLVDCGCAIKFHQRQKRATQDKVMLNIAMQMNQTGYMAPV
ncbi:hypothetical protein C8J56DRAFT_1043415 [Mycena floridula]|nr:hypothetical protein C8J56DRAFT_1043415 [Mycena floridula]